jgi:RNA polymerase sigma-70 factor, ECF subfamily
MSQTREAVRLLCIKTRKTEFMNAFEQYRPLLFAIAYRMLGTVNEAEDMVQDTYLRYQAVDPATIQAPKAFLTTVISRLCLDYLRSAQVKREQYIGPWLPEPLPTQAETSIPDPAETVEVHETLSMAFLILIQQLSALERAIFLLREVFDYGYDEIARIVGREEAACRQVFSRAKKHITENRPRYESPPETHTALFAQFLQSCQTGDVESLKNLLADDVAIWSDGGGKATAATRPILGPTSVVVFIKSMMARATDETSFEILPLNGKLGLIVRHEGSIQFALQVDTDESHIRKIWITRNPDKLTQF